jgi:indolepyruvate decarboxylase
MANTIPTVAEYLVRRIAQLGVNHAFGVPGDYSFPIDNAIESCPGLDWVLDEAAIAEKAQPLD